MSGCWAWGSCFHGGDEPQLGTSDHQRGTRVFSLLTHFSFKQLLLTSLHICPGDCHSPLLCIQKWAPQRCRLASQIWSAPRRNEQCSFHSIRNDKSITTNIRPIIVVILFLVQIGECHGIACCLESSPLWYFPRSNQERSRCKTSRHCLFLIHSSSSHILSFAHGWALTSSHKFKAGHTPVHYSDVADVARLLIERGATINAMDKVRSFIVLIREFRLIWSDPFPK